MKNVVILLITLVFSFINVVDGECKIIKSESISIIGEPNKTYDEAARTSYYELNVKNDTILIGLPYQVNDSLKTCLDNNSKVRLQGKVNTIEEKYDGKVVYRGRQFDTETVKCTPIK